MQNKDEIIQISGCKVTELSPEKNKISFCTKTKRSRSKSVEKAIEAFRRPDNVLYRNNHTDRFLKEFDEMTELDKLIYDLPKELK